MNKSFLKMRRVVLLGGVVLGLFILNCANVQSLIQHLSVEQPQVTVVGAQLKSLSFSGASLSFDVRVQNPNPVGIDLKEFHYDFLLDGHPFLSGDETQSLKIEPNGSNLLHIPVAFTFETIYKTWKDLRDKDTTRYQLKGVFGFDVPVLGRVRIPASK
ncbi:MAG: LEA type 2 family protein, partial [Calditrichaeota bacterium]|nr:LEA type 2 family protein [Calditrichota bacterium]